MLYEKDSPPLTAFHSPRWNTHRNNARTRTIITVGVVILMLTSLALLHYSTPSPPHSSTNLHSLKSPDEVIDLNQQNRFGSLRKPHPQEETKTLPEIAQHVPSADVLEEDIPNAPGPAESESPTLSNATLDFGKIYVLNLDTRGDRRDEMALIAAASGLELTFVPGVDSILLEKQSLPDVYGTPQVILEPGHLACFRGHANIWRTIVEEGMETALILEDDVDWDLNIREITPRVKEALGRITKNTNVFSNTRAWDLLYLGTCYEEYFEKEQNEYTDENADEIFVDIPSDAENLYHDMYDWVEELIVAYYNDISPRRVLVKAKNPVCTHGYAVTQRGARKLLLELNEWMPFPVDITMIHYISEGRFKAYSVLPPLFVQWRNTNDPKKNSDIEGDGISLTRNWGFVRSARKHLVDWYGLSMSS